MKLSDFQNRCLAVPEQYDLLLLGGRSGGKSVGLMAVVLSHVVKYGPLARILFLRRSYPALRPVVDEAQRVFRDLGASFDYNAKEVEFRVSNGATIVFAPLDDSNYFRTRFQGHSYSMVAADELASWSDPSTIDLAFSLLRAPHPVVARFIGASNPGPGSHWLVSRFWSRARGLPKGTPFSVPELGDREFVVLHSVLADNPALDQEASRRAIIAGAGGSRALAEMWLNGTFEVLQSQYFAISESLFVRWPRHAPDYDNWKYYLGCDHGSRAPFAAVWCAEAKHTCTGPDGRPYKRGDVVVYHETHSADETYLRAREPVTVADIASALHFDGERLGFRSLPHVTLDAQCFSQQGHAISIADEYLSYNIPVHKSAKPRLADSYAGLNEMIAAAGSDMPAIYVDRAACPYLVYALSNTQSDERDPQLIDPHTPFDHVLDALRYSRSFRSRSTQYVQQVVTQHMNDVIRHENPDEVRLNMYLREATKNARPRPRVAAVKPKPAFDFAASIDGKPQPPLTTSKVERK